MTQTNKQTAEVVYVRTTPEEDFSTGYIAEVAELRGWIASPKGWLKPLPLEEIKQPAPGAGWVKASERKPKIAKSSDDDGIFFRFVEMDGRYIKFSGWYHGGNTYQSAFSESLYEFEPDKLEWLDESQSQPAGREENNEQ